MPLGGLAVSCTATVTHIEAGSQVWDMDDGGTGTINFGGGGTSSINYTYIDPRTYHVTITVTGLDGSTASDSADVVVT